MAISNEEAIRLLRAIAAGSEPAMDNFYFAFESFVFSYALYKLNDPHAAADVLNEVMMAVWRGADRFAGNSKVSTWLLGIAKYKYLDQLRKRGLHQHEELEDDPVDERPSTDEMIDKAEDAKQVRKCIDELSPAHREVILLAYFEDLPYGEIAKIVGCPEGTVKTRMFHAKENLKRRLERLLKSD